ncbi:MAG: AEC family transporter, partial [Sutterella wadsworthensis]
AFTGSTVLFVGVPMTTALFGEEGIPYLLVYFFANCVFIWTVGLYAIQTDGVAKTGGARPKLVLMKSVRMLFSPPLLSFIVGIAFAVLSIPIPHLSRPP